MEKLYDLKTQRKKIIEKKKQEIKYYKKFKQYQNFTID